MMQLRKQPVATSPAESLSVDTADAATLSRLLDQQDATVESLCALSEQQREIIEQHRSQDLLHVLSRRQVLIDQFTQTHKRIAELMQRRQAPGDDRLEMSEAQRATMRTRIEQMMENLASVLARDNADERSLVRARGEISTNIESLGVGAAAVRAYGSAPGKRAVGPDVTNNRFADERG